MPRQFLVLIRNPNERGKRFHTRNDLLAFHGLDTALFSVESVELTDDALQDRRALSLRAVRLQGDQCTRGVAKDLRASCRTRGSQRSLQLGKTRSRSICGRVCSRRSSSAALRRSAALTTPLPARGDRESGRQARWSCWRVSSPLWKTIVPPAPKNGCRCRLRGSRARCNCHSAVAPRPSFPNPCRLVWLQGIGSGGPSGGLRISLSLSSWS